MISLDSIACPLVCSLPTTYSSASLLNGGVGADDLEMAVVTSDAGDAPAKAGDAPSHAGDHADVGRIAGHVLRHVATAKVEAVAGRAHGERALA